MLLREKLTDDQPGPAVDFRDRKRIMLVGPGFHFLSGLSVYVCRMANALSESHDVSVLLLNRLIPTRLYPGGHRAGHNLTSMRYDPRVRIVGEVDWHWGRSMAKAAAALRRERPDVIVLQWWTAATLHTYLLLAWLAACEGIPVLIEFHEAQDTGEARMAFAASYCRRYLRRLIDHAAGAILHNEHDLGLLKSLFGPDALRSIPVEIAPHGPYDHVTSRVPRADVPGATGQADDRRTRVLFFGLIRPYKGLEDLIYALNAMPDEQAAQFEVDVVGETWKAGRCQPTPSPPARTATGSGSITGMYLMPKPPTTSGTRTSWCCRIDVDPRADHCRSR